MKKILSAFLVFLLLPAVFPAELGGWNAPAMAAEPVIVQIAAGHCHSFALFSDGSLYAWGWNEFGQLGDGTNTSRNTPVKIGTGYTAIAAGALHSLALKGNTLFAWGVNANGQLGDGTLINSNVPVQIGTGYTAIAAGGFHSLALRGNTLFTWGNNADGQLGDGTLICRSTPEQIGTDYTAIVAGVDFALALKGNTLYTWGLNKYGELGDGTITSKNTPVQIGTGFTAISAGFMHSLALKDNTLYAWGWNNIYQLGDGTDIHRTTPEKIGTGYTAIAANGLHSFAFKGNTLYGWGSNFAGQLGDGTLTDRKTPVRIGTGYSTIVTGGWHSFGLKGSTLYAWGSNRDGQLGDGTNTDRKTPIEVKFPSSSFPNNNTVKVQSISLSFKSLSLIKGDTAWLTALVSPENASNKAVTWKSSNCNIAKVDSDGKVTAVRAGKAIITATTKDGKKTARCTVAVRNRIPLKNIGEIKTVYIQRGNTYQVKPKLVPSNADVMLIYTCSNKTVLDIDWSGFITTYATGESTVTVKAGNISRKFTVKVGEVLADSVRINYYNAEVKVGETLQLLALASPRQLPNSDLTWKSSDTSIAAVSATGLLTAYKKGTVKITVTTWNDKQFTSTFYVTD